MLAKIDRFGLEAITGRRKFYHGELSRLIVAENIVMAYQARARSDNWADFTKNNMAMSCLLAECELLIEGLE